MNPYPHPMALRQALSARAKTLARALGVVDSGELVRRFYLSRLLARVFVDDPEGWLLKGGQALLVRYSRARHSKDLDLLYRHPLSGDLGEASEALARAATRDLGDHLRFELCSTGSQDQGRPSRNVRFQAYLGTKKVDVVSVDLVADLEPVGTPITRRLAAPFDIELDTVWPEVRLYPMVDHIADKVCALYEHHAHGVSSRYKDLVDLVVIALRESVDGRLLHGAIRREVVRRRGIGTRIRLPERFAVPDPASWADGYRAEASSVIGLDGHRELWQAEELVDRFVTPLLGTAAPCRWDPEESTWHRS